MDHTWDLNLKMKMWKKSDWANSWKGSIPSNLKDEKGNIINFSDSDIDDIKAQLASSARTNFHIQKFNNCLELENPNCKI